MPNDVHKYGVLFTYYNNFLEEDKATIIANSIDFFFCPEDNHYKITENLSSKNELIEDEETLKIILFETLLFAGLNRPNIGLDKRAVFLFPLLKKSFPEATTPQLYNEIDRIDTIFRYYLEPIETRSKDFNPIPSMSNMTIKYGQDPAYNIYPCWYIEGKDISKEWDFHYNNRAKKIDINFCFKI